MHLHSHPSKPAWVGHPHFGWATRLTGCKLSRAMYRFALIVALLAAPVVAQQPAPVPPKEPGYVALKLQYAQSLSSGDAVVGQRVWLEAGEDIRSADGTILVHKGA